MEISGGTPKQSTEQLHRPSLSATDAVHAEPTAEGVPPASRCTCTCGLVVLALLTLVLGAYALFKYLPMLDYLVSTSDWVRTRGAAGAALFVCAMVTWIVLFLPSTPLELLCSFTYGFWWSLLLNTLGKVGGGTASFLVGRRLGHERVQERFAKVRLLRAMEAAIARQGWFVVLLMQSAFVPMWVKNYGLSVIAAINTRTFALTCFLAGFPYTVALGYVGSTARNLIGVLRGEGSVGYAQKIVIGVGIAALALCIVLIGWYVRRSLRDLDMQDRRESSVPRESQDRQVAALVMSTPVRIAHSPMSSSQAAHGANHDGLIRSSRVV